MIQSSFAFQSDLSRESLDYVRIAGLADPSQRKSLESRVTGRFFTPPEIGCPLADRLASLCGRFKERTSIKLVDPFCGDGRLIRWFLLSIAKHYPSLLRSRWEIGLWDCDKKSLTQAEKSIGLTVRELQISCKIDSWKGDSLSIRVPSSLEEYDIVVTNPPWETIKPDRRELETIRSELRAEYTQALKRLANVLGKQYPLSRPGRYFSGWGVNLARVGVEASLRLLCPDGLAGIVSPPSLLADQNSESLRKWIFSTFSCPFVSFFPAEARMFSDVDQPVISIVLSRGSPRFGTQIDTFGRDRRLKNSRICDIDFTYLRENHFILPISFGIEAFDQLLRFRSYPRFTELEGPEEGRLWAGREIDETNHKEHLGDSGFHLFLKGRMIERYAIREMPTRYLSPSSPKHVIPPSVRYPRIVWRDVSRPTQKRRIQATLIPPMWITGNSLGVAHFHTQETSKLLALLGVMSSLSFEFQVRAMSSTAHISLGALRRARIPDLQDRALVSSLADTVRNRLAGDLDAETKLECLVARSYDLSVDYLDSIIRCFDKISNEERLRILDAYKR